MPEFGSNFKQIACRRRHAMESPYLWKTKDLVKSLLIINPGSALAEN